MGLLRVSFWMVMGLVGLHAMAGPVRAVDPPPWLPRYSLDIKLDVKQGKVLVRQLVTWHNRHARPSMDVVFNAHAHYSIRPDEIGFGAKTLEILRMAPHEGLDLDGPALQVDHVR